MADTDGARIGDVKAGFVAAKDDANRRLKRDGSNVDMTPEQAAAFRTAIGAGGGGGGGSGDVVGPATATADSLVLFSGTTGKVIKGGPALGVGSAGSVPTRADADERYQSKLGFTPADAADTYTKDEVDAKIVFATVAEVRAGAVDGKVISPKVAADAQANVVITRADAAIGINFDSLINATITLDANGTLGPPSGGYPGKSGVFSIINASGTASLAFNAAYRMPKGGITLESGVNAATRIPYMIGGAGAVILFPASKWSA